MNVSPEKTEPELFPNWPNQPNHLNVSREISQNVKQAQELEATNALDQHLTNTSIPSKKIPTLMTTKVSNYLLFMFVYLIIEDYSHQTFFSVW